MIYLLAAFPACYPSSMRAWWIVVGVACGGGAASKLDAPVADMAPADTTSRDAGLVVTSGQLDPTFGSGGMVAADFGGLDFPDGAALLPSGRLLVGVETVPAGSDTYTSRLVAFTTDGAIDTSFGSAGSVTLDTPGRLFGVLADGSLIIGTDAVFTGAGGAEYERRLADGSLDSAYGSAGHAYVGFVVGGQPVGVVGDSVGMATTLDSSGRIYVGAQQADGHVLISRLTATGYQDIAFGGGTIQAGFGVPRSLATLGDGSLLVEVAEGQHAVVVIHVLANATIDPSYMGYLDGVDEPSYCGLAVDAGGRTVLAGTFDSFTRSYVARFTAAGVLDTAFSGGFVPIPGTLGCGRLIARAAGGSLVSVGVGSPPTAALFAFADSGATATEYLSPSASIWREIVELPSGNVFAIGTTGTGSAEDVAIARFLP